MVVATTSVAHDTKESLERILYIYYTLKSNVLNINRSVYIRNGIENLYVLISREKNLGLP